MPTLDWMGKSKVVNHHRDVPYRVLVRDAEKSVLDSHGSDCGNMIVHGDNLEALKALLPEYEGKVDCIYIDPPYNTGEEKWVYNDNVNDPRIKRWLGQVVGKEGEDFSRHDKWLCMMYPRLKLLKKFLSPVGVIFISIDDNELHNLRLMCDEIFSSRNFEGIIHWRRRHNQPNDKTKLLGLVAEHILVYSASKPTLKEKMRNSNYGKVELTGKFSNPDNDARGAWASKPWKAASGQDGSTYSITAPDGTVFNETWLGERKTYEELLADGRIYFPRSRGGKCGSPRKKYFEFERQEEGQCATNWWPNDIAGCNQDATDELKALFPDITESKVFDNPKPTTLVERIVRMCSSDNSIILDAFAGSGTTGSAVFDLNRRLRSKRKFILVELNDYADTLTAERLRRLLKTEDYCQLENGDGNFGFSYYELGTTLFNADGTLNPEVSREDLKRYVWYTVTHREYVNHDEEHPYLLGEFAGSVYYLAYEPSEETTLTYDLLKTLTRKSTQTVVYADRCVIAQERLDMMGIVFKQVPREIVRM